MAADLAPPPTPSPSRGAAGAPARVALWGHAEFLRAHATAADVAQTTTLTGYNPMLEEFGNCRWIMT